MIYDGKSDQIVLLIKHRMLDLSIKQKDIVEQTGLAKSTVSNFLNGRTPSPSRIQSNSIVMQWNVI